MDTREITEEVRWLCGDGEFRPFAQYDGRLDRVLVVTRDCSVGEERINGILTVFGDIYSDTADKKYIGFAIEGARRFCSVHALSAGTARLKVILDMFVADCPKHQLLVDEYLRPLITEFRLDTVTLPNFAP